MNYSTNDTRCATHSAHGCNWLTAPDLAWCPACVLIINPGANPGNIEMATFNLAIRRLRRQFTRLEIEPSTANPPLLFRCVLPDSGEDVVIGHQNGLVTLDMHEADPAVLSEQRKSLGERYRTPLGHVRHETGHWHWQAYVYSNAELLEDFRDLFGDERADYNDALQRHYTRTDTGAWAEHYITAYASAHPWEDYAESFAHLLHIADTFETAQAEGLAVNVQADDFDSMYAAWVPMTIGLNELSRSMGLDDPYPFSPTLAAIEKLRFVHRVITSPGAPAIRN